MAEKINSFKFSETLLNSHEVSVREALIELLLKLENSWVIELNKVKSVLKQPQIAVDANVFVNNIILNELPHAGEVKTHGKNIALNVLNEDITEFSLEFLKYIISFNAPKNVALSLKKNKDGKYFINVNFMNIDDYDYHEIIAKIDEVLSKINGYITSGVEFFLKRSYDLVLVMLSSDEFVDSYLNAKDLTKKLLLPKRV